MYQVHYLKKNVHSKALESLLCYVYTLVHIFSGGERGSRLQELTTVVATCLVCEQNRKKKA